MRETAQRQGTATICHCYCHCHSLYEQNETKRHRIFFSFGETLSYTKRGDFHVQLHSVSFLFKFLQPKEKSDDQRNTDKKIKYQNHTQSMPQWRTPKACRHKQCEFMRTAWIYIARCEKTFPEYIK